MASIKQRGNSYQITVSLKQGADGKYIREYATYTPNATTPKAIKKEVEEYAREFEKRVKNGEYYTGEKMTFRSFMEKWRIEWAEYNLTLRVKEEYCEILERNVLPSIGHLKMSDIRPAHIQKILVDETKKGKAVKTVKYIFTTVNSVMKYAYRMGVIKENPCLRCEVPKRQAENDLTQDNTLHYFTLKQAQTFISALDMTFEITKPPRKRKDSSGREYEIKSYVEHRTIHIQYKAFFLLAIYGGFRRGEISALTWNDIDFDNHTVSITKAVSKTRTDGQTIKAPKTKAGKREIILPSVCFEVLKTWYVEQKKLCLKLGTQWTGKRGKEYDDNFIFINLGNGEHFDVDSPSHKFKEIIAYYNGTVEREEDKLPDIRLHDLRHTSATLLLSEGIDIETVAERLGHSRASVTLDIYGHALKTKDEKASNLLENLFEQEA